MGEVGILSERLLIEFSVLTMVAIIVALLARWRGFGIAIPLTLAGILIGLFPSGPQFGLHPETVLVVILAPLVFGEALSLGFVDLRRARRPILFLAILLVIVGAFAVGTVASLVIPGIPFAVAVAFGAILGPTDAVSVSATARRAGLSHRLVTVLEGESLVNDGAALTFLRVAILAAAAGTVSAGQVSLILVQAVVGGVAFGLIGGFGLVWLMRKSNDLLAINGLILVAPFPLYLGSEVFEGSGILAVVVAAIVVAHQHTKYGGFRSRLHFGSIWSQITFVLQSVAFIFIGIEIPNTIRDLPGGQLSLLLMLIPLAWITIVVVRFVFMFVFVKATSVFALHDESDEKSGGRDWIVAAWAGSRGPISGLAAFSLPLVMNSGEPFPYRELVIATTLCVVLITLLLGPTLAPLARFVGASEDDNADQRRDVEIKLAKVALDTLEQTVAESEWENTVEVQEAVSVLMRVAQNRVDRALQAIELDHEQNTSVDPKSAKTVADALRRKMGFT
ncbi:cation:proton antiporter [Candidatus Nanopelagicales bacterium]|nr:cation:proton antiporter [Candidatus Nanopelagicales bacterium]